MDGIESDVKVSVLVCCYNQERYIGEALTSVVNQKPGCTMEVLVGDDRSTDSTPAIVERFAAEHPGLVTVCPRTINLGFIRNYFDLAARARGEILMVLGGDDYWLPGKVAAQVEYLDSNPAVGLCFGHARKIDADGNPAGDYTGVTVLTTESLLMANPVPALTIAVRASVFRRYVAEVNPLARGWMNEDWPLLLWCSLNSAIGCIPRPLGAYRWHSESLTHSGDPERGIRFRLNDADMALWFIGKYRLKVSPATLGRICANARTAAREQCAWRLISLAHRFPHPGPAGLRQRLRSLFLRLSPRRYFAWLARTGRT